MAHVCGKSGSSDQSMERTLEDEGASNVPQATDPGHSKHFRAKGGTERAANAEWV